MSKMVKLGAGLLTAGIAMTAAVYFAVFHLMPDSFCVLVLALDTTIGTTEDIYYAIHDFEGRVKTGMIAELPERVRLPAEALMQAIYALSRGARLAASLVLERIDPLLSATLTACETG